MLQPLIVREENTINFDLTRISRRKESVPSAMQLSAHVLKSHPDLGNSETVTVGMHVENVVTTGFDG